MSNKPYLQAASEWSTHLNFSHSSLKCYVVRPKQVILFIIEHMVSNCVLTRIVHILNLWNIVVIISIWEPMPTNDLETALYLNTVTRPLYNNHNTRWNIPVKFSHNDTFPGPNNCFINSCDFENQVSPIGYVS